MNRWALVAASLVAFPAIVLFVSLADWAWWQNVLAGWIIGSSTMLLVGANR